MISFSPAAPIFLYSQPTDMRKSFNGLFAIVKSQLERDARGGGLFLFVNRKRTMVKCMYWDSDGIAIWMKRLERGTFQHPKPAEGQSYLTLDPTQWHLLVSGIDLESIRKRKRYTSPIKQVA